ncbi:MAG: DUF4783 domain-containing protein [Fluviicola sp.]|jgi:hypothetical protein|nr:DUF4783 domain-containing protein [Fluviicola sp.]MBP6272142.1 DUF4783 domain-containing protein [Fluviicola sp.]
MKLVLSLIYSLVLIFNPVAEVPYASVESAFQSGDANRIIGYGKSKLLLNIQGNQSAYSPAQANQVLKDFFQKKPASSFKFTYKGVTEDGATAIGTYNSKTENFRVTVRWSKVGNDYFIESIAIEKS